MKTTIIIPTYNEKENIQKLIPVIFSVVPQCTIIVVDDNSPDGTAHQVLKLKSKYPQLHLIKREKKAGRGSAVIEGFKYAHKNMRPQVYIEMDADFSHNPKELPQLINFSKPKNIVLASRYVKGGKIVNWPISRRINSWLANLLIRFVLKLPLKDNTNGFRCYPKEAIQLLLNHDFISKGHILLGESAYLLYKNGFGFVEIPSNFKNRKLGKSNATLDEFFNSLLLLFQIKQKVK